MKLFKNKKKACCQSDFSTDEIKVAKENVESKGIKILGSGCHKCNQLEEAVKLTLENMQLDISIEHVTDFAQIAMYGVMSTPALVVNGKVVSYGKVLSVEEITSILEKSL